MTTLPNTSGNTTPPVEGKVQFYRTKSASRFGFFMMALLLHLLLFLLIASWVIFAAPKPETEGNFGQVKTLQVKVPTPPEPAASGASASNPLIEPQPVIVPVTAPIKTITSVNASFSVDASKALDQSMTHMNLPAPQGTGLAAAGAGGTAGQGNSFGSMNGSDNLLSGYLYDLKQTKDKQPTDITDYHSYLPLLGDYVKNGWDDTVLEKYYRSKAPISTSTIAISTRPSEDAPKAFGLEKEVQPGLWVIHYHARVEAPSEGDYRLAGFADNIMVVRINGKLVLDGGWDSITTDPTLHQILPYQMPSYIQFLSENTVNNPNVKIGPPFHMQAMESVDMDVIIGDCGGVCGFFLLVEKEGNTYEKSPDGTPKLPFFQLDNNPAPTFGSAEEHPPYSSTPEPWQSGK